MLKLPKIGVPFQTFTFNVSIVNSGVQVELQFTHRKYSKAIIDLQTDTNFPTVKELLNAINTLLQLAQNNYRIVFKWYQARNYFNFYLPKKQQSNFVATKFTASNYTLF